MKTTTFIGVLLLVVAGVLAVVGISGMPAQQCSGSYRFVKENCGSLLHGYLLLFGGFAIGAVGAVVLVRGRGR